MLKIGKRTLLIFLVGYLMYWFPFFSLDDNAHLILSPFAHTRIMAKPKTWWNSNNEMAKPLW